MDISVGSVLNQRFRLEALERRDALGDDYRALDIKRNILMRIKLLRNPLPGDPALLTFQAGNSTLQTLNHPHIVPFYGLFQEQQLAFLVERYVDGDPLRELILERAGQPAPVADAMIYLKALCSAAAYAQGFGIVHCNITPANIWLEQGGNVLLGGFGLARSIDTRMTSTGLAGPPAYLAPEMLQGQGVTPATDIYGLGLVFFELLTGQHPFLGVLKAQIPAAEAEKLGEAQLHSPPPNPHNLNPAVPEGLAQVALTALAKSPRERYQSPQEMFEIACAMFGRNPNAISDRFGGVAGSEPTMIGMPPVVIPPAASPQTMVGAPMGGYPPVVDNATQVYPAYNPSGQPATMVMPDSAMQGEPYQDYAPSSSSYPYSEPPGGYAGDYAAAPPARRGRSPLLWVGIVLGILACLVISGAGVFWLGQEAGVIIMYTDTPAPTSTPFDTATNPPPPTDTPLPVVAPVATLVPPTAPPAPPSPLPVEIPTLVPSDTPAPLPTLVPTRTLPVGFFTVTMRNRLGFPAYAFRDGVLMGTDPIPSGMYIFYRNIPAGRHSFTMCRTQSGNSCQESKFVNVDQDLTIVFP